MKDCYKFIEKITLEEPEFVLNVMSATLAKEIWDTETQIKTESINDMPDEFFIDLEDLKKKLQAIEEAQLRFKRINYVTDRLLNTKKKLKGNLICIRSF